MVPVEGIALFTVSTPAVVAVRITPVAIISKSVLVERCAKLILLPFMLSTLY
jgi:hypothetical protein